MEIFLLRQVSYLTVTVLSSIFCQVEELILYICTALFIVSNEIVPFLNTVFSCWNAFFIQIRFTIVLYLPSSVKIIRNWHVMLLCFYFADDHTLCLLTIYVLFFPFSFTILSRRPCGWHSVSSIRTLSSAYFRLLRLWATLINPSWIPTSLWIASMFRLNKFGQKTLPCVKLLSRNDNLRKLHQSKGKKIKKRQMSPLWKK